MSIPKWVWNLTVMILFLTALLPSEVEFSCPLFDISDYILKHGATKGTELMVKLKWTNV